MQMRGLLTCRKLLLQLSSLFPLPQVKISHSKRPISSLASYTACLEKLDHCDWLAPKEVIKIFSLIADAEQLIASLEKVSSRKDYKPNEALYMLVINKLAYFKKFDYVEVLLEKIKEEKCKVSDEFFYTVIKNYLHVANHPEQAIKTMFSMPEYRCWPTIKILNLVLNVLVCSKHYEIIHDVYLNASRLGVIPDTCCFNILIRGLCDCGKLGAAFSLLHEMDNQSCKPNARTFSTLMHALCKADRVSEALELCDRMEEVGVSPDTILFNILISGLCKQGKLDEGMDLLKKMALKGCYPNSGTYQALLYGLLDSEKFVEAKTFMDQMILQGLSPSFLSYKSLIHGLCKRNSLDDMENVLKQMVSDGFAPQMGTWKMITESMLLKVPVGFKP